MPKPLSYLPLENIGVNGLNTQANPATLDSTWLTKAENIVLRESGRISFRKGFKQNVLKTSSKVGSLTEHKIGTSYKIFAGVGANIYTVDFTSPSTPWTASFATGASDSDWQFINFNKQLYGFQAGSEIVNYDDTNASKWDHLKDRTSYSAPAGVTTFDPSCGMGYYGRLWVGGITEEKDVLYYSDTLIGKTWGSGAAGYVDLKSVWGTDEIVAIHPFYGQLVIFGKHNIALYTGPADPTNMVLGEVIRGVGCSSRDSVQAVGDDLLFLSDTGLKSLRRTSELDKVPMVEFSINVKDTLIRHVSQSNVVKGCYVENEGVYLLSFAELNITYVFDIKHQTPNKVPRVTQWVFDGDREPSSMVFTESKDLLVGQLIGSVATYEEYFDSDFVDGGTYTDHSYTTSFLTPWLNLGNSVVSSLLKKLKAVIDGGSGTTATIRWFKDFNQNVSSINEHSFELNPSTTGSTFLWGASTTLYGNKATGVNSHTHASTHTLSATYAPIFGLQEYNINLTQSAKFLQIEMNAETQGYSATLQSMAILYKQGKIR
jgi:hypothetical protein